MAWPGNALHGIGYGMADMAWYTAWPGVHGMVCVMAWYALWHCGHGMVYGMPGGDRICYMVWPVEHVMVYGMAWRA